MAFRPERSEKAKPPTDRRDGSRNGVEHLRYLYEEVYCDRGNAELFIKDHKNGLKSGRASCHKATANQFRLFLHSAAYMLMHALRDKLPDGAQLAHAQFDTIRMSREFRTVFLRESFCITLFFGAAFRPPCVIIGAP